MGFFSVNVCHFHLAAQITPYIICKVTKYVQGEGPTFKAMSIFIK